MTLSFAIFLNSTLLISSLEVFFGGWILNLDHSTVLGVDGIIFLSWLGGLEYMLHVVLIILSLPNVTGNITFIFCFIASSVRLESCHVLTRLLLVASSWYVREDVGTGARLKVCKVLISSSAFSD